MNTMRPVLVVGLAFAAILALLAAFVVSIGIGAVNYITACGINPVQVLLGRNQSLTAPRNNPTAAPVPSASESPAPAPPSGSLFATYQANPEFSAAEQAEQRYNAALIVSIGQARPEDFTDKDIGVAVSTAIQESWLLNLDYGDRDSLGLFQQRPGIIQNGIPYWGTAEEIMDPAYSINRFYDELAKQVSAEERATMSMMEVAIAVQIPSRSAYMSTWKWDELAMEIVQIYSTGAEASGPIAQANPNATMCTQLAGVSTSRQGSSPDGSAVAHPAEPGYGVSAGWGYRPGYPGSGPHKGIDISNYPGGSLGKPVYAAFSGVVVTSGIGKGCSGNNVVTILHDDGFETGYLHMDGSDITVSEGDRVVAGQQIGAIGNCGDSTGPHIHFEVNPGTFDAPWLSSIQRVTKYGEEWLDPVAFMDHYGIDLRP